MCNYVCAYMRTCVRVCVRACVCVLVVRAYECVHWREGGGVMQVCAGQKVCVRVDVCEREYM